MQKIIFILCLGILLTTCDDGDIFEVTLDFEDEFMQCGDLVFFKINESTSESLSIKFGGLTIDQILDVGDDFIYEATFPLGGSNIFNYRSYSNLPANAENVLFCNDIPPSNLGISRDEVSLGGEVLIRTILIEDDNDGIPANLEDRNGNGDFEDDDFDNDGIPDYLDPDDDGDNVLTVDEIDTENLDGDDNPLTNFLDTDGDGDPDYLDTDDDEDGVLTRDEDSDLDLDPTNDRTIDSVLNPDSIPDYLNDQISTITVATEFRTHTITLRYTVFVLVSNISLPSINQQTLDFGTLNDSSITSESRVLDPIFN